MSESLIRLSEVQRRTGYSKAWLYRLMSEKRFPLPVKIGARAIAFIESEIDAWIEARIKESRPDTASEGTEKIANNRSAGKGIHKEN